MKQDGEKRIAGALAILKHVIKVRGAQQALLAREALPVFYGRRVGRRANRDLPSDRESRATLRPSALQDQTTTAGGHAGAKTVRSDALELAGLIGSFHREIRRKTKGWDA
jgi:hypothetical protein